MNPLENDCTNEKKMHYLVYKITNARNNMTYIGVHQTLDPNDDYMGSGSYIRIAIQKEGLQNFKKEILFDFDSEEEMVQKEKELVTADVIRDPNTYNMIEGGKISPFQSEVLGVKALHKLIKITSEKVKQEENGPKEYKWIVNVKLKKTAQIPTWLSLPQELIDLGWKIGQGSKKSFQMLSYKGEEMTLLEWAEKFNVDHKLLEWRYDNWNEDEVLSIPFSYGKHKESSEERKRKKREKDEADNNIRRASRQKENYEKAKVLLREFEEKGPAALIEELGIQKMRVFQEFLRKYSPTYRSKYMQKSTKPIYVTYNGKTMSISRWVRTLKLKSNFAFYDLVKNDGLTYEQAIERLVKDLHAEDIVKNVEV